MSHSWVVTSNHQQCKEHWLSTKTNWWLTHGPPLASVARTCLPKCGLEAIMCRFNNPIPLILVAPKWSQNAGFCWFLEGVSYWDGSPGFRMELYNYDILWQWLYIYIYNTSKNRCPTHLRCMSFFIIFHCQAYVWPRAHQQGLTAVAVSYLSQWDSPWMTMTIMTYHDSSWHHDSRKHPNGGYWWIVWIVSDLSNFTASPLHNFLQHHAVLFEQFECQTLHHKS